VNTGRDYTGCCVGVNSFKFFMAYKGVFMLRDDELFAALQHCRRLGALARVHAENGDVIAEVSTNVQILPTCMCSETKAVDIRRCLWTGGTLPGTSGSGMCRHCRIYSLGIQLEAEATNRACVLAQQANCPLYVVHVMSKGAARAIADNRARGCVVFGEPIAAGLGADGTAYFHTCWRHAAAHVLSPPLSTDTNTPDALMDLLAA
jgi:dihydropyrimidinase